MSESKLAELFNNDWNFDKSAIILFAMKIVLAILIIIIGFKLIKILLKAWDNIMSKSRMDPTVHSFMYSFLKIGLKVLVVLLAINEVGVATSSIIAVIGSAGLALALSLQGSLANIAGGVVLLFVKPFQVGDYIKEEHTHKEGRVQAIGIMYTKLLSVDNQVILIPNGKLADSTVTNVMDQNNRLIQLFVGIDYNCEISKARKVIIQILDEEKKSLSEEPYKIYVNELKDSCIEIGIRFWVKSDDYFEVKWRVLEKIKTEFDKNHIVIPYNKLDVSIVNSVEEAKR